MKEFSAALKSATLLVEDIRAAHKAACGKNALLEVLLREQLANACKLAARLNEIDVALKGDL